MTGLVHDWTHYNRWVDSVAERVGRETLKPPRNWWELAKAFSLAALALGAACALILFSWPSAKVFLTEVVGLPQQVQAHIREIPKQPTPGESDDDKVVRNFVIFSERPVEGIGVVVTGWKFATEIDVRPTEQWCYLSPLYGAQAGEMPHLVLPRFGKPAISAETLSRHMLTTAELYDAQKACRWFL